VPPPHLGSRDHVPPDTERRSLGEDDGLQRRCLVVVAQYGQHDAGARLLHLYRHRVDIKCTLAKEPFRAVADRFRRRVVQVRFQDGDGVGFGVLGSLADQHAQRATELNPSEYHNLCNRGYTLMSLDDFDAGIDCFGESLRRNPLAPNSCLLALGLMEYVRDNYAQSAIAFSRMLPSYLQKRSSMAAAFGQLGYAADAKSAAREFRRYAADRPAWPGADGEGWPAFWSRVYPHLGRNGFAHVIEGLGKAGLPVN